MASGCVPLLFAVLLKVAMSHGQSVGGSHVTCRGPYAPISLPSGQNSDSPMCAGSASLSNDASFYLSTAIPSVSVTSCLDIKKRGLSRGSAYYSLTSAQGERYWAYCDMNVEGGGWTLFATKVSPTFQYLSNTPNHLVSQRNNSAGCIPTGEWTEVMFRFLTDSGASRLIFNRYDGEVAAGNNAFVHALQCGLPFINGHVRVGGFYRHTPYARDGQRDPPTGYHTIGSFAIYPSSAQLSEAHGDSNHWIDMWSTNLGGNKFYTVDMPDARGRKCVAGTCYSAAPILILYR